MKSEWRNPGLFVAGSLVGGALVLATYLQWFPREATPTAPPPSYATAAMAEPQPAATPVQLQQAASCPSQALLGPSTAADGKFDLQAALSTAGRADPHAFLTVAREANEQGRLRDTEVALLAACHVAERDSGANSAPVADVKSQVGQHYVALAARPDAGTLRDPLVQRASALFTESAQAYAAALGANASKTRMAQQRLAALSDPATLQSQATAVTVAAPRSEAPDTARMGAARSSLAERPPLRTEDLRQVDHDLERLYAQARSVTRDPAGMQQRHQQALAQRSACQGDQECLRQWYAQRRRQLFAEF